MNDNRDWNDLEARFLGLEHRFFPALGNYFEQRSLPRGDKRRDAARSALLWILFSRFVIGSAVAGGGVIATFTLLVLIMQLNTMRESNDIIRAQNEYFQRQIELSEIRAESLENRAIQARRTNLIEILYEVSEDGPARFAPALRKAALYEFVRIERQRGVKTPELVEARLDGLVLDKPNDLSQVDFSRANLEGSIFRFQDLSGSIFDGAKAARLVINSCNTSRASFKQLHIHRAPITDRRALAFLNVLIDSGDYKSIASFSYGVWFLRDGAKNLRGIARDSILRWISEIDQSHPSDFTFGWRGRDGKYEFDITNEVRARRSVEGEWTLVNNVTVQPEQ